MTVISYQQKKSNKYKTQTTSWSNNYGYQSRFTNSGRLKSHRHLLGSIKASYLIFIAIFLLGLVYVYVVTNAVSVDYTITSLKTQIQKVSEENSSLREQLVASISGGQIQTWAQNNGFAPLIEKDLSYLDPNIVNLAQGYGLQQ